MGITYLSIFLYDYKFICIVVFFCLMVISIGISILLSLAVIFSKRVKYMLHVWMIPFYIIFKIYTVHLIILNLAVIF